MLVSDGTEQLYGQSSEAANPLQEFCSIALLCCYTEAKKEPSGFQLKLPLIEVLDIAQELLDILDDFATKSIVNDITTRADWNYSIKIWQQSQSPGRLENSFQPGEPICWITTVGSKGFLATDQRQPHPSSESSSPSIQMGRCKPTLRAHDNMAMDGSWFTHTQYIQPLEHRQFTKEVNMNLTGPTNTLYHSLNDYAQHISATIDMNISARPRDLYGIGEEVCHCCYALLGQGGFISGCWNAMERRCIVADTRGMYLQ